MDCWTGGTVALVLSEGGNRVRSMHRGQKNYGPLVTRATSGDDTAFYEDVHVVAARFIS